MSMSEDCWPPQSADEAIDLLIAMIDDNYQSDDKADEVIANCRVWAEEVRRNSKAMRALEELTPNGSEFVGDVEACVAWIREERRRTHELIKRYVRERRERDEMIERCNVKLQEISDKLE